MTGRLVALAILAMTVFAGVALYRNLAPFNICIRHQVQEAMDTGSDEPTARAFAENYCRAKIPLR